MPFRIVTLGDSVPWGQGLPEADKFDSIVSRRLAAANPGATLQRFAHSGAVIGDHPSVGSPEPGEVPVPRFTIIEQVEHFTDAPENVDLVLLNGGINDVGVATILNPLALIPSLQVKIESACYRGMLRLLQRVTSKFTKPSCRIAVTGYYTIFSAASNPLHLPRLMGLHGVGAPAFMSARQLVDPVVARCAQFFHQSTDRLSAAVHDSLDPRIVFIPSGYADVNAIFAPNAFLWGLDAMLNPEDPIAATRHPLCDIAFPEPILQLGHREQCYRASAGHPNVDGAQQYANQIAAVLGI